MREERSCKSEERVENYPQSFKNEWKINEWLQGVGFHPNSSNSGTLARGIGTHSVLSSRAHQAVGRRRTARTSLG